MMKLTTNKIFLAITLLFGIAGCSSTPEVQEFAPTANATEELQRFSNDMTSAGNSQVDVLSPSAYRNAHKALNEASLNQKNGKDSKVVLHQIAIGRAHLDNANRFSQLSRTNLEAVVSARQDAITSGAQKAFPEDFADADDHLRSVTSQIENNDLGDVASRRTKLQKEYLDVELKAIKHANLSGAQATITLAEKEGAKEYAKQSLAIAEKSLSDTEAFIVANRHQTAAVKARADATTKAANHLLKITRASKAGKNVSNEQAALALESEQNKTQEKQDQLATARSTAKDLAVETGALRSSEAFNQSFESARKEFTKKEAEVYRQGDRLVIRLRALEFPTNESVLRGSNFPLLAKVAKVIKGFEGSKVLVEGHTDSDGGKESNIKLSTERAQAISDYLISSDAIDQSQISVVGHGYERPLGTNKTASGKAQNRRVDIIISPQSAS